MKPPVAFTAGISEFGFRLTRGGAGSELDFGGIDTSKIGGTISYTPVTSQTYVRDQRFAGLTSNQWEVQSTGLYVNGKSASNSFAAAIDTGTTLVCAYATVRLF